MARNAYILSGLLHIAAIALLFLMAGIVRQPLATLRRYQPVRLVTPVGMPGISSKSGRKVDLTKPAQPADKLKSAEKDKAPSKNISPATGMSKGATKSETATTTSKAGSWGGGSVNLEGANFPYPYYLSNIQIKILSNFQPAISGRQAKDLKAVVFFIIDKDGRISQVKLEDKSGHFLFDQEAQRAILRSNPLPALPPAFGSDRLGVHFEFVGTQ